MTEVAKTDKPVSSREASRDHSVAADGNQILGKSMFGKKSSSPGLKRPVAEQLNLKMKDTYVSPALGLKYSHERLMERYKHEVLSAKNERHREVLEKVKEKAKPMDHEELHRRRMEYSANRMQKQDERDSKMHKQLYDFNHSGYQPAKSKAYLKVVENKDFGKNPELERLEKARKAIETRKHYSEIVKDIFFKDALLNNKSGHQEVNKQIVSLRDIKHEAEMKRKDEYEHHKLMHELGKKYLEDVRHQNINITPQARKMMDEKRFARMQSVDKPKKSRKYLDQVARDFKDPREVVMQKDLMKKLNPTRNSDSHNAFLHNVKYFDDKLIDQETKLRYKATKEGMGLDLGDKYINSIQSKLHVLQKEVVGKDKNLQASKKADQTSMVKTDPEPKPKETVAPKADTKQPSDAKTQSTNPTDQKAQPVKPTDPKAQPTNPTDTKATKPTQPVTQK